MARLTTRPAGIVEPVRAAGGVVVRGAPGGALDVLAVHRPRYDDWSLPKGKREPGETDEVTAVREVEEETGYRCRIGVELPPVEYVDRHGRQKIVRFWTMTAGEFTGWVPNAEVDEVRWIGPGDVEALLTYDADRRTVAAAVRALGEHS